MGVPEDRISWTELDYWRHIEALGGAIWSSDRARGRGRPDITGLGEDGALNMRALQHALALELSDRFGIILPQQTPQVGYGEPLPDPPEGKRWYRDWYDAAKREAWGAEYNGMICSACPFSRGLDHMIKQGGRIPCSQWMGFINFLRYPHECALVTNDTWSRGEFLRHIAEAGGEDVLVPFDLKEITIRGALGKSDAAMM